VINLNCFVGRGFNRDARPTDSERALAPEAPDRNPHEYPSLNDCHAAFPGRDGRAIPIYTTGRNPVNESLPAPAVAGPCAFSLAPCVFKCSHLAIPRSGLLGRNNFRLARQSPGKCTNVLGDKERQIFGSLSALTMLQSIRADLFGYDPHLEVLRLWRSQPPRDALFAASIERKALPPIGSRHGTRGTTRSMLRSRSALEKCSASTGSDGVSVMRMHLKAGQLLFAATLRTGTSTLASG
jgi:hypothetical protein